MIPKTCARTVFVALVLGAAAVFVQGAADAAQGVGRDIDLVGSPIQPAAADPAIAQTLQQISARQIQHTIETLVSFGNRNTLSSMKHDLLRGSGVNAAADWIEAELRRYSRDCGGCLEVKRDTFLESPQDRIPEPTTITNIYAVLHGTDPAQAKRRYLVTGHYDSRNSDTFDVRGAAPGANDDASGVAVSLECARVLSKLKPAATLVFAAVAGEEQGLNGSRHLAMLAQSEGWQLDGVLNNDIVGGNTTPGDALQNKHMVRVFSEGIAATSQPDRARLLESLGYASDSPSRELARAAVEASRTYAGDFQTILELRRDRFLRGGDHTSFNESGFAGIRLTEWREDFNHQHQDVRTENGVEYGDALKFVDFQYVAHVATVNAAALASLAHAPPPPKNARMLASALTNATTIEWDAGEGAPAGTQYEIVFRETSASQWQRAVPAALPRATLEVSKDNVIFGVRALDAGGHRSLAVVPMPQR